MEGRGFSKVCATVAIAFSLAHNGQSQNLIPNSGFEGMEDPCTGPVYYSGLSDWVSANCSIGGGYFNACSTANGYPQSGVPANTWGSQEPADGQGYASTVTYIYDGSFHPQNYLAVPLTEPLVAGMDYCFSMHISLAGNSAFSTSTLHAIFTTYYPIVCNGNDTLNWTTEAQLLLNTESVDTTNWTVLSGGFTAAGGERYVTIGNFFSPSNTDTTFIAWSPLASQRALYYIDMVELAPCDVGMAEVLNSTMHIWPNPALEWLSIALPQGISNATLRITDMAARLVTSHFVTNNTVQLDISALSSGMYVIHLDCAGKTVCARLVKP